MFEMPETIEKSTKCAHPCAKYDKPILDDSKFPEIHTCSLLAGHQGPCSQPCAPIHLGIVDPKSFALSKLMELYTQMQQSPFSLSVEQTTPEQREFWTNFLEALRLVSREIGSVNNGSPEYRKEAALAWLRVVWENVPDKSYTTSFVENGGTSERTRAMMEQLQACFTL